LADFGPFSKREEKTKIRAEIVSHGARDSDASTSPGGGAAGVPLRTPYRNAVLRIAAAFGLRTPHILRRSCAVSLQKRALKTARSRYGPDVNIRADPPDPDSRSRRIRRQSSEPCFGFGVQNSREQARNPANHISACHPLDQSYDMRAFGVSRHTNHQETAPGRRRLAWLTGFGQSNQVYKERWVWD